MLCCANLYFDTFVAQVPVDGDILEDVVVTSEAAPAVTVSPAWPEMSVTLCRIILRDSHLVSSHRWLWARCRLSPSLSWTGSHILPGPPRENSSLQELNNNILTSLSSNFFSRNNRNIYLCVRKIELKGMLNWCVTTSCIILGLTCLSVKLFSEDDVKSPFSRTEDRGVHWITSDSQLSSELTVSELCRTDPPPTLPDDTCTAAHSRVWMKCSKHRHLVSAVAP